MNAWEWIAFALVAPIGVAWLYVLAIWLPKTCWKDWDWKGKAAWLWFTLVFVYLSMYFVFA